MLICLILLVSNNQWRKLILKGQCQFQGYFSKMQSDTQDGCNCLFPRSRTLHWIRLGSSCRGQCKSTRNTQRDLLHNTGIYNKIASNCLDHFQGENSSELYLIVLNYNHIRIIICQLSVYYSSVFSTSLLKYVNTGTQSGSLSTQLIKLIAFTYINKTVKKYSIVQCLCRLT